MPNSIWFISRLKQCFDQDLSKYRSILRMSTLRLSTSKIWQQLYFSIRKNHMWIHNQNFWFIDWFAQWFLWVLSWLRTCWIYQRTSRFSFPLKVQEFISKYRFCCCNLKKESIRCSWHRKLAGEVFELTWPF